MIIGESLPVDRLHNLENLLDMYEYNELDVLVNEAIANAVDVFREYSIKTGKIDISFTQKNDGTWYLSFHNDAPPMSEEQFYSKRGYHMVSFSSKQKGKGIGFAGVGAKLFLVSKQGGEIITITGKDKNNFMASKMYRTENDLEFRTTQKFSLKEIIEIPEYIHSYGTTYSVRLTKHAYQELREKLPAIIQFWWNYALITKQIIVKINGKLVSPWIPRGDKFKKEFPWKKQKIPALCFISKEKIPELRRHIVFTVFGKRIYNKELDLAIRIKGDFANRVFCIVDLSILANQLTSNKENFKKSIPNYDCKSKVEDGFWKFLEDQKLLNVEFQQDIQIVTNDLTKKLDELLDMKEFKDLNPFLNPRTRTTLTINDDGDTVVGEEPGDGASDGSLVDGGDGSDRGIGDGTSLIEDEDAERIASKKEKKAKGLKLVFTKKLQTHSEEARVETKAGAIVIDELHPMYVRYKNESNKLQNYNLMRIVIEALIRHKNDSVDWDAKETMYRFRNLLHATLGIRNG